MKEKKYKDHSMYENTTTQYKNINQEKSVHIHLLFLHDILEVAYLQTPKILKLQKLQKLRPRSCFFSVWWEIIVGWWKETSWNVGKHRKTSSAALIQIAMT